MEHLAHVFSEFHPESKYNEVKDRLVCNITSTITDWAAVNHAAIRIVNETFGTTLIEVNCHLHPLDTIATKARGALKSLESGSESKLFDIGCLAKKVCSCTKQK